MPGKKLLFLYSRLPDYFLQCILHTVEKYAAQALIISEKGDANAPYAIKLQDHVAVSLKSKEEFIGFRKLETAIWEYEPDLIYVAGWSDKVYKQAIKGMTKTIPVIVGMDNPWKDTVKQRVASMLFGRYLRSFFSYIWICGYPQYVFARRLGYPDSHILKGLYVADHKKFIPENDTGTSEFHKTLVYHGRLVAYKNIPLLVDTFISIEKENRNGWKLRIIGSGPDAAFVEKISDPDVSHQSFVQPEELPEVLQSSGAYCLPSTGEHWGVAMHEATSVGLPIISSYEVGASSSLLIDGYNGFVFDPGDKESLRVALLKLFHMEYKHWEKMKIASLQLSMQYTHDMWAASLMSTIND